MHVRAAATVAALAFVAGVPAFAQEARPARAPGVEAERIHQLMVGDRAPELAIGEWVKGEAVTGFEEGRVYVVEFWATWCGPCIYGMPHVSELQDAYRERGVTVIGVNIWDDPANVPGFMADRGAQPSGDELMRYTVAVEKKIDGENVRNGEMSASWMRAAGRGGIPSAFIVDQKGYIAWAGHPLNLDHPLKSVVVGEWDIAEAAEIAVAEARDEPKVGELFTALRAGDSEKAGRLAGELIDGSAWHNGITLYSIVRGFVNPDAEIGDRHPELMVRAAERASALSDHKLPMMLDNLAWAYHHAGEHDKAVATIRKAIEAAPENQRAQFEKTLERIGG